MASAGHERTERRHAVRRRAILDAAATEFAEAGYQAATLDRIGDRVGLTKASLYHYVQGKEQLLAALLDRVTADIAVQATVPADADPQTRLRRFVRAHVRVATTAPEGMVLAENIAMLMARTAPDELATIRQRHEDLLADIIRDGVADGAFRAMQVRPAVKLLFGALNSIPRWFDPTGPLDLDQLSDQVVDLLLSGLTRPEQP